MTDEFAEAWPFPHAIFDGAFNAELLDAILADWPGLDDRAGWTHFSGDREEKWAWTPQAKLWPAAQTLIDLCNSGPFLEWLEAITGIDGLQADPLLVGGGPHEISRGGRLGIHADFNRHPVTGLDRRLNALLYLNHDWDEEWGGNLELWGTDRVSSVSISPTFNRLVVFATTSTSWHGHPRPLACPADRTRRSFAFYYYTAGRPPSETVEDHSTVFVDIPDA